ncbi:MAG: 2-phosphosulfolactate phosphatase [Paenibacillus sp.]|jgi:2-phosphosulfolactate phosphatase|nr:2-phosphosulfolactate phosphatase [Paenibacillus sp.]
MQVNVISSVNEARSDDFIHKTVIVIDVLRATSTIVTALAHDCSCIIPVETVQQAKQLQTPGDRLGGERYCKKIAGFHYGNSPLEYMSPDLAGSRVIMTTTNGTRAIQKSLKADHVLAGCLLNASACARKAASLGKEIAIVCAGTQDHFCFEDGLCAGVLVRELLQSGAGYKNVNDVGLAMLHAFANVQGHLEEALLSSASGQKFSRMGCSEDVSFCSQLDLYSIVPAMQGIAMC